MIMIDPIKPLAEGFMTEPASSLLTLMLQGPKGIFASMPLASVS